MPNENANAVELVKALKKAALDAMESTKPVNVCFGTVISAKPLQIDVEQRMTLGESQLILTRNVTQFTTMVTVQWETEYSLSTHKHSISLTSGDGGDPSHSHSVSGNTGSTNLAHTHDIEGTKQITVHNALEKGEQVILLRQQEGQKFIVLDRIGVM